jgi:hypothetical protein
MQPMNDPDLTPEDAKSKEEIARAVDAHFKFDGHRFLRSTRYRLDAVSYKNRSEGYPEPKMFYEAKARDIPFGHYKSGLLLSLSKIMAAHWLREETGLPCNLFVKFSDGVIAGVSLKRHDGSLHIAGRTDTNYFYDVEPEVLFPWDRFTIIVS